MHRPQGQSDRSGHDRELSLLDETTVVPHLVARGVLSEQAAVRVQALGGGVSNVVLAVDGDGRHLVVKQALPRLRVAREWLADPARTATEGHALRRAREVAPDAVPAVVDSDEARCILAIECAPATWSDWKSRLLGGEVDAAIGERLGRVLGALHRETLSDPPSSPAYGSWEAFEQLRLTPFHETVAQRHPAVAPIVRALAARMHDRRRCLVHGDCSPKNVLVGPDGLWLIDFEIAHRGDPTFDVAFMTSHLLLKALHLSAPLAAPLADTLAAFRAGHLATAGGTDLLDEEPWLMRHVAALLLARVDGTSPAEYLDARSIAVVRTLALRWLKQPPDAAALWAELRNV